MICDLIKVLLLLGLVAIAIIRPDSIEVILGALTDAYIAVSTFVAATLAIFYLLEHKFQIDTKALLKRYAFAQVPIAACLGSLPGCGGAIMVVTQYVRGRISFGSIVAALTATMGDAAFLLLAQEPLTGLLVMVLSLVVGVISGYVVDHIHGQDFMRPVVADDKMPKVNERQAHQPLIPIEIFWYVLIIPGFVMGVMSAFQMDINALLGSPMIPKPEIVLGVSGALLCVGMWLLAPFFAFPGHKDDHVSVERNSYISSECDHPLRRVVRDTNFITSWVVFAFLVFELFVFLTSVDLGAWFNAYAPIVPLVAILFGFIPGCGPQILVTTLYLERMIPLSAQLGNAISNDGDALFPAIALAPKASILATLYSAVPAFIVAYGYMAFFE